MPLTKEQLKFAYDTFQDVSGGLHSDWIFSNQTVAESEPLLMIGACVSGTGAQRSWSEVWVNIKHLSDSQRKLWDQMKGAATCELIEEKTGTITRIGFKAIAPDANKIASNANKLQELPSEVVPDKPDDTVPESEE